MVCEALDKRVGRDDLVVREYQLGCCRAAQVRLMACARAVRGCRQGRGTIELTMPVGAVHES